MIRSSARQLWVAALAILLLGISTGAHAQPAQPQPSPAAIALAREIVLAKGAGALYDPIVPGVIDRSRQVLGQTNPMVGKPLEEVATKLKAEFKAKATEVYDIVSRAYAVRFTEAELKELAAFYKSPLGKKVTVEEPEILSGSMDSVNDWAGKFGEEVLVRMRQEMRKRGHEM